MKHLSTADRDRRDTKDEMKFLTMTDELNWEIPVRKNEVQNIDCQWTLNGWPQFMGGQWWTLSAGPMCTVFMGHCGL